MDIEEKSRRDLIERYKRVERKEQILKHGITKGLKNFLKQQCFDVVQLKDVQVPQKQAYPVSTVAKKSAVAKSLATLNDNQSVVSDN